MIYNDVNDDNDNNNNDNNDNNDNVDNNNDNNDNDNDNDNVDNDTCISSPIKYLQGCPDDGRGLMILHDVLLHVLEDVAI